MPTSEDLVKALDLLIHDLRAPLSVAQGYLRLLREDRLPDQESRTRALADSSAALGRMARLCESASAFAHEPDVPTLVPVAAATVAERVRAACVDAGWDTAVRLDGVTAQVRVSQLDSSSSAIVGVLRWVRDRYPDTSVLLSATGTELRCAVARDAQMHCLDEEAPTLWESWPRGGGFPLAVAHREITRIGGRVWSSPGAAPGVAVGLPLVTT